MSGFIFVFSVGLCFIAICGVVVYIIVKTYKSLKDD